MYERFTDRARKIMRLANREAQRHKHGYLGTEHILLGLLKEGSGVAVHVIKGFGVDPARIAAEVDRLILCGTSLPESDRPPPTPRAKKVIEYAMEEARDLNHNYVGSEHILLGLLREQESPAAQVLMNFGLTLEEARSKVRLIVQTPVGAAEEAAPPQTCPKCGDTHVVRVLWRCVHLFGRDLEDIEAGRAILGFRVKKPGPPWVCLRCDPEWSEVHRLAMQDYEWQLVKEEALACQDFTMAAKLRDAQIKLHPRLASLVKKLLENL